MTKDKKTVKGKEVTLVSLVGFLAEIQKKYSSGIWLKIYDDGSGSIGYDEDEISAVFLDLGDLDKMIN